MSRQPFFCSQCGVELKGKGIQRRDGQWECKRCEGNAQKRKQGGLPLLAVGPAGREQHTEQKRLFNPKSKRNVAGFQDDTGFHPIRGTKGYNEFLAGDFDTDKQTKRRQFKRTSAERERESRSAKEWEDFERKEQRRAQRGAGAKAKRISLATFVRKRGGIAPGRSGGFAGELARLGRRESGTTGLINQHARQGNHRQTAEYVMDAANVEGYRDRNGDKFSNIGDFIYALEQDATGDRKYYDMSNPQSKLLPSFRTGRSVPGAIATGPVRRNKKRQARPLPQAVLTRGNRAQPKPAHFPATRTPQRVTRIMRVRDLDTGEQGTVLGRRGTGAHSFLKVKWDGRTKATLIKPDQLAVVRNRASKKEKGKGQKSRRRFVFKIGARIVSNPATFVEILAHGANAATVLSGINTARHMLSADQKPAKKVKRRPSVSAAGKRLAQRRHGHVKGQTRTLHRKVRVRVNSGGVGEKGSRGVRNPKPSATLQRLHKDFLGKENSGKVLKLYVAPGQPMQNSALAPLIKIEMANGSEQAFKLGSAWLGATEHNLPIDLKSFSNAGKTRRLRVGLRQPFPLPEYVKNPAAVVDFGEVKKVWYQVAKPHLYPGQGVIRFHHTMGEDGGRRPHLMMRNGRLFFKGGDYTIEREGIAN